MVLTSLIQTLKDKSVIELVKDGGRSLDYIVFHCLKPNGSWRLTLDVSSFNTFFRVNIMYEHGRGHLPFCPRGLLEHEYRVE